MKPEFLSETTTIFQEASGRIHEALLSELFKPKYQYANSPRCTPYIFLWYWPENLLTRQEMSSLVISYFIL